MRKLVIALSWLVLSGGWVPWAASAQPSGTDGGFRVLRVSGGKVSTQAMGGFKLGKWKDDDQLWLEGDDRFTVDGRLAIHGTGSEDYFNCGWYAVQGRLNGPGGFPLHGFPVYRMTDQNENQAAAYRWHVTDPVAYEQSIVAEMEHGADNKLAADYRSAAFF